ncbi:MAG: CsbD family protein [Dehalococcoidia bacterium]|nr:CsbD family protein [Dehalococcoidia bacterium]
MAGKKIEGRIGQVKGRVRVAVGKVTGEKSTELKGKAQRARGKLMEKLG